MSTDTRTNANSKLVNNHQTSKPPRYHVIMHNDDYTTMEFVIEILQKLFHKTPAEATRLMLTIHNEGQAICGCYPLEIAETKTAQAHCWAQKSGHPLRCSINRA